MVQRKKPARMGRYANLASTPKSKSSARKSGRFAWFRNLSLKKKIAFITLPILAFLIITPLVTYALLARDVADKERLMNRNNTGIVLNDKDGKPFYSIGRAEHRTLVPLSDISESTKKALIASEDKDFYKHGGFSVFSIFRAAFTRVGGGSTITQQLAKNTLLSDERSMLRKYQELTMSIAIEQQYSKDEILSMYLNSVYYGENSFGIEEAARAYFKKSPKDLNLAESAMLIGLLPAPSAYSPISGNQTYAKQRQTTVLTRMVNNGFITEAEKQAALGQELVYGDGATKSNSIAPHYAEMVIRELTKKYGEEKVKRSGYQVQTSLDSTAQAALNESLDAGMQHVSVMGGSNASGVVIDPKTGSVRALVGSADYNNKDWGKVNMVTTARQPGSSFKPIYYAYALADGAVTPATILHDKPTDFGGGYKPLNADKKFRGDVSLRKSISQSLNIPSVEVMQKYGITKSVEAANRLGIDTVKRDNNYGLALALGAAEAPLMNMTNAYAAFANQGQQFTPMMVTSIKDKFNNKIFAGTDQKPQQAISKEGAYLISNILSDNNARAPIFGSSLTVPGRTVAVKTGTTNDSRDAWTIGYNPSYAVGVWVGNNNNEPMASGGSDMAGPIWRNTMRRLLANERDQAFPVPSGVVQKLACSNGGLANRPGNGTYNEYFMAGALPTEKCNVEPVKVTVCNLDTKQVETINEEDAGNPRYSKDTENCKPKQLQVCDLEEGRIVAIDEDDYDASDYSKDTANCKKSDTKNPSDGATSTVTVCDTTTGQVVTIPSSQNNPPRYSSDTMACQKKPNPRQTP